MKAVGPDQSISPASTDTRIVAGKFSPIGIAVARKRNLGLASPFDSAMDAPNPLDNVLALACFGVRKWAF